MRFMSARSRESFEYIESRKFKGIWQRALEAEATPVRLDGEEFRG